MWWFPLCSCVNFKSVYFGGGGVGEGDFVSQELNNISVCIPPHASPPWTKTDKSFCHALELKEWRNGKLEVFCFDDKIDVTAANHAPFLEYHRDTSSIWELNSLFSSYNSETYTFIHLVAFGAHQVCCLCCRVGEPALNDWRFVSEQFLGQRPVLEEVLRSSSWVKALIQHPRKTLS